MVDVAQDGEGVPINVAKILDEFGIFVPDFVREDPDTYEQFQMAQQGFCMTCHGSLGPSTMVIAIEQGVVGLFCGGACLQDMQVLGFLNEQTSDITDNIKFRGGQGDKPESE